jgi:hypothetical protein
MRCREGIYFIWISSFPQQDSMKHPSNLPPTCSSTHRFIHSPAWGLYFTATIAMSTYSPIIASTQRCLFPSQNHDGTGDSRAGNGTDMNNNEMDINLPHGKKEQTSLLEDRSTRHGALHTSRNGLVACPGGQSPPSKRMRHHWIWVVNQVDYRLSSKSSWLSTIETDYRDVNV